MKFKSLEKVHQGKFVTRYDLTYETKLGNIKKYEMISRNPEITGFEEVVRLDTEYISHWSLGLDIRILLKTVKVVIVKDGAL